MNRLEQLFERGLDRILRGDQERRLRQSSWAILVLLLLSLMLLMQIGLHPVKMKGREPVSLWKLLLHSHSL